MATRNINDLIATQKVANASYTLENGQIILATGTITTSKPAVSATQTWNAAGVAFVADTMNITDTASAAASLLWERKLNSQRKHQFTKTGLEIFNSWTSDSVNERGFLRWASNALYIGTEQVGATNRDISLWPASGIVNLIGGAQLIWPSLARIRPPSDGVIVITNGASSDFNRLQFGGTTSSFPALKRSTTQLHVKLADDSAHAQLAFLFPSSDPVVAGVWWDNAGTLTRSAG